MNNSIYAMNHSPRMQEPESSPLAPDRDLVDLHKRLTALVGSVEAVTFGLSLTGKDYDTKCREYLYAIAVIVAERSDYKRIVGEDFGTRVIISGGEVMELDAPQKRAVRFDEMEYDF